MKRNILFIAACMVLVFTASSVNAKQTLYKLGTTPFSNPPLTSVDDLKNIVGTKGSEIKDGFTKAGYPDLYDALVEQFSTVEINTIKFHKGEKLMWMLYNKNGTVKVSKDVTWGAEEPFDAYQFYLDQNGKRHNIVVPWICVNFALKEVTDAPAAPVTPAPAPAPEPAPEPAKEPEQQATQEKSDLNFVADLGYMYQYDTSSHLFGRIGLEHKTTENFSVLAMVGIAPKIYGDDGENAVMADLIGVYHWDAFFVGLGVGGWFTNGDNSNYAERSKMDFIADIGYRIWGERDGNNGEIFLELRSGVAELDQYEDYGRIGAGIRFRF